MSFNIAIPQPREEALAALIFTHLDLVRSALAADADARRFGATRFYSYAIDSDPASDPELAEALVQDATVAREFAALLGRIAAVRFPAVAAAATGDLKVRTVGPHRLRFEASRAEPSQTYVIVELAPGLLPPTVLFAYGDARAWKIPLPSAQGGIIQLLLGNDDPALIALRNVDAEAFLV